MTVYYTAAANTGSPECGSNPQWAGLVCKTYPAATPSSGPTLPTTTTAAFTYLLAPQTVTENSGTVTRTTTTTYKSDGRVNTTATTVIGLAASTPNTKKTTTYDTTTGLPTVLTATNADNTVAGTITTGYDTWGRQTTYQPSGDTTTTTVYNAAGDVATVTDANGSTTYTYDGTDANGKTEHRGLATKVDVTTAGSTWTSTGAYDSDSTMTVQKLPGGVTQLNAIDNAGEPSGLSYAGQVTTVNTDGSTTVDPNGPWLSWSLQNDVTGRVTHEWTPDGTAFTTGSGSAIPYDRHYTYDNASRLTQVNDRTAESSGVDVEDPAQAPACVTRTYGFDTNDNRLTKATAPAAGDGSCSTAGATTVTRAFDTADRPVSGANGSGNYVYDALGRSTTLPASDAPRPTDGDVTLSYYDNDLARSITQAGTTTTLGLDALDRRSTETVTNASGSTQTIRHYTETSDNPTWVTLGATTQRYAELIGSDLALTVGQAGAAGLTLANPHGDVVTTVDLNSGSSAEGIVGWNNYDEYGNAIGALPDTGFVDYGWLGAKQRAVSGAGLILMGVRLFNTVTGTFASVDPVSGGNANAYVYPSDPMNHFDLDGRKKCSGWKKWACKVGKIASYASYIPGPIGLAAGLVSAASYGIGGDYRNAVGSLFAAATSYVGGKYFSAAAKLYKGRYGRSAWTGARKMARHVKRGRIHRFRTKHLYSGRIRSPRTAFYGYLWATRSAAGYAFGVD
jgi:RHS repeat-associated protein